MNRAPGMLPHLLRELSRQPVALLGAVLAGIWVGLQWPQAGPAFAALATIYLSLLQAAALPFLLLAAYFGVQRLAGDGDRTGAGARWRRTGVLALAALLAMLLCALGGALLTEVTAAGARIEGEQAAALGRLALRSESAVEVSLHGAAVVAAGPVVPSLVPANLFQALAAGAAPSVLIGVLLLGAAVAARCTGTGTAQHLHGILEAVYRGLELTIALINTGLPLVAFVLAAAAASPAGAAGGETALLASLLGSLVAAAVLACALALGVLSWRLRTHPWRVLIALREPLTVCLFAPVGAAALPEMIEALSGRLGLRRGAVELLTAVLPVFVKTGEALFFAVVAVFIANLYGHLLTAAELVLMALTACWFALTTIGIAGAKGSLWAGVLQAGFGLPLEALLPLLVAVELLSEGARNLVSYLVTAALIALGTEPPAGVSLAGANRDGAAVDPAAVSVLLVVGRRRAWLSLALLAGAALLVFCAGLGAGLRKIVLSTL